MTIVKFLSFDTVFNETITHGIICIVEEQKAPDSLILDELYPGWPMGTPEVT